MLFDTSDTTWMLIATVLVFLMIPALALFEAGLLRKKNLVSTYTRIFWGIIILGVMWFIFGFSLSFGNDNLGVIGNFDLAFLNNLSVNKALEKIAPTISSISLFQFEMMFATVTPLLLTGAIAERMKFKSFLIFIISWSVFIYYPLAHWVWGGGWLHQLGVVDFAGGIVVHTSAGMSAIAAALILGRRKDFGSEKIKPHNVPMAVFGASLLWMGWFGFNGGSGFISGTLAANTISVTQIASASSAIVWLILSMIKTKKIGVVSAINGAIAGLAGITPASGYVNIQSSFVIGIMVGLGSFYAAQFVKQKLKIDDALDVGSVHGTSGIIGSLSIGIFASSFLNSSAPNGLLFGNNHQILIQALGVGVTILVAFVGTLIIMKIIKKLIGVRVSTEIEEKGLDLGEHFEETAKD